MLTAIVLFLLVAIGVMTALLILVVLAEEEEMFGYGQNTKNSCRHRHTPSDVYRLDADGSKGRICDSGKRIED